MLCWITFTSWVNLSGKHFRCCPMVLWHSMASTYLSPCSVFALRHTFCNLTSVYYVTTFPLQGWPVAGPAVGAAVVQAHTWRRSNGFRYCCHRSNCCKVDNNRIFVFTELFFVFWQGCLSHISLQATSLLLFIGLNSLVI